MPFTDQATSDGGQQTTVDLNQPAGGQPAQQPAAQPAADHTSVFLVAGERAFRDADSVIKNIENAQSHIHTLEAERKTDREQLVSAQAEIVRLKKIEESLDGRQNAGNSDTTNQMSNEEIAAHAAKLAVGQIQQANTVEVQNQNLASAEAAAEVAYGKEAYQSKVSEIAAGLNMTLAAVDALGKTSPDAFKRLFLPGDPGQPHQPTNSTVNLPTGDTGQQQSQQPVNIVKAREPERLRIVADKMKAAGVEGY